ncbi:MAG: hypothetical protein Q6L60_04455, partial [Thermostichus sp. HHBFW_bins_43]
MTVLAHGADRASVACLLISQPYSRRKVLQGLGAVGAGILTAKGYGAVQAADIEPVVDPGS